ncbi:unnamed protein product [Linum tenue]|uniref:Uncharacterized protein n=1 Tax=Linum tenue TaxID=586396 RepID=A0AAV0REI7_9ROSI|nr:unnamed protein product [Linum tenue]
MLWTEDAAELGGTKAKSHVSRSPFLVPTEMFLCFGMPSTQPNLSTTFWPVGLFLGPRGIATL